MKKIFCFLSTFLILVVLVSNPILVKSEEISTPITENQDGPDSSGGSSNWGYYDYEDDWKNTGTSLPYSVNYSLSNLLETVQAGDILYEQATDHDNFVGHAAIVEGIFYDSTYNQQYIRVIEATFHGVNRGILTPIRLNARYGTVLRVDDATSTQKNAAVSFAIGQIGKDYFLNLFGKGYEPSKLAWYCSELVWAAYYNQGIDLSPGINCVRPIEFLQSILTSSIASFSNTIAVLDFDSSNHHVLLNSVEQYLPHNMTLTHDSLGHHNTCLCGYSYNLSYTYSKIAGTYTHRCNCSCGHSHIDDCDFVEFSGSYRCTKCRQIVLFFPGMHDSIIGDQDEN